MSHIATVGLLVPVGVRFVVLELRVPIVHILHALLHARELARTPLVLSLAVSVSVSVAVAVRSVLDRAGDLSGAIFDLREEARQQQRGVVQQEEGVRVFAYDAPGLVPVLSAQGLLGYAWRRSRPSAENGVVSPESSEVGNDEFAGKDRRSGGRRPRKEGLVGSD